MPVDVFVSYRRNKAEDSQIRSLVDTLKSTLKRRSVYLDVQREATGRGIREDIKQILKDCSVVVVVINAEWIRSIPRLLEPNDIVRLEIAVALELDLDVLPVVFPGGRLPKADELPSEIVNLLNRQVTFWSDFPSPTDALRTFAKTVQGTVRPWRSRALTRLAESNAANATFGLAIVGGLLLFASSVIGIHRFFFDVSVKPQIAGLPATEVNILREGGAVMAWNWTLVLLLVTPMMAQLALTTLKESKTLLEDLGTRKMIYYMDLGGARSPITARRLWDEVTLASGTWVFAFAVIAVVMSTVNWWRYAGQWPFKGPFDLEAFMRVSTGPDWHVGWALHLPTLDGLATPISSYALAMYLTYGIGSVITFSYYAFLFNLTSTLSHLASSAVSMASAVLRLYVPDRESGGLAAFRRIQAKHADFCYWSLAAMYAMALRNAYLPLVCRMPDAVVQSLGSGAAALEQCTTMPRFASAILHTSGHFVSSLFRGEPQFSLLVFTYSEQNDYVLGSMLYGLLIASFFLLISIRMRNIVVNAQNNSNDKAGNELLRAMQFENWRVLIVLVGASMSTVFLNLGPFVIVLAIVLRILQWAILDLLPMLRNNPSLPRT